MIHKKEERQVRALLGIWKLPVYQARVHTQRLYFYEKGPETTV